LLTEELKSSARYNGSRRGAPAGMERLKTEGRALERFQAKWKPVRVKKTRQNKN
jgi:hypothetical protein